MADLTLTAVTALSRALHAVGNHRGLDVVQWSVANTTAGVVGAGASSSLSASVIVLAIPIPSGTTLLAVHQSMSLSVSAQAINFGISGVSTAQFGSLTGQAAAGYLTSKNLPYKLSLSDDAAEPRVGWLTVAGLAGNGGPISVTAYLTRDTG